MRVVHIRLILSKYSIEFFLSFQDLRLFMLTLLWTYTGLQGTDFPNI